MYIRYNESSKIYEYDTSVDQDGSGPWLVLPIDVALQLTDGVIPDARFPDPLPALSGANLTNLNASNLASGTIPNDRFPNPLPALSGANLTNLNASNISSGTIPSGRFPVRASYTPVLESSNGDATVGTGATVQGAYIDYGAIAWFYFRISLGSGFSFGTGTLGVTLPFTSAWPVNNRFPIIISYFDNAVFYSNIVRFGSSAGMPSGLPVIHLLAGSNPSSGFIDATTPFSWVEGDSIYCSGFFPK